MERITQAGDCEVPQTMVYRLLGLYLQRKDSQQRSPNHVMRGGEGSIQ